MSYVSRNFTIDRATRELGEDAKTLEQVDQLRATYLAGIMLARHAVHSQRAKDALAELELGMSDIHHNASWTTLLSDALEAFADAKVVQIPIRENSTGMLRIVK